MFLCSLKSWVALRNKPFQMKSVSYFAMGVFHDLFIFIINKMCEDINPPRSDIINITTANKDHEMCTYLKKYIKCTIPSWIVWDILWVRQLKGINDMSYHRSARNMLTVVFEVIDHRTTYTCCEITEPYKNMLSKYNSPFRQYAHISCERSCSCIPQCRIINLFFTLTVMSFPW